MATGSRHQLVTWGGLLGAVGVAASQPTGRALDD